MCIQVIAQYIFMKTKRPSPMTKAPTPTEMSKGQSDNTNKAIKKFD